MITTVTLNPMLDKTVHVDAIRRGNIQRSSKIEMIVGGKGVNVSRQLVKLGCETMATGFAGGEIGGLILRLLDDEGIDHSFITVAGMTREGVTYCESDGTVTAVFEPPHHVSQQEASRLVDHVESIMSRTDWIVCSGSSPCPEADDVFAEIISLAHRRSINTVLDSYGTVCLKAADASPTILKMNKDEFEQTFATKFVRRTDYTVAFDQMFGKGISYVIVTDGPRAIHAGTKEHRLTITPPAIVAVNPTGSGDSMIGGILYGFVHGWDFPRALAFGAAAGAANAQKWSVASSSLEEISALEPRVTIERLS